MRMLKGLPAGWSVALTATLVAGLPSFCVAQDNFFSEKPAPAANSADSPAEDSETSPAAESAPAAPSSSVPQLNFRFVPPNTAPSAEEVRRIRALAETVRGIEIGFTPRTMTNLLDSTKPAEQIRVEKLPGDKYVLWVGVNYIRYGIGKYTLVQKSIAAEDWNRLIDVIADHNLMEWAPDGAGSIPIDAAAHEMRLRGEQRTWQTWFGPLENGDGAILLADELSRMAQKRVPYLPLAYLRPSPPATASKRPIE